MGFFTFTVFEVNAVACLIIVGDEILLNLSEWIPTQ